MKCLDKKRIKLKQGETLALNERIMLSMVSITLKKFIYNNITRNFNLKVGAGLKATTLEILLNGQIIYLNRQRY